MTASQQTSEYLAFLEAKIIEARESISSNQGRAQEETIAMLKLLMVGRHEIDQGRYKSMDDVFAELDKD
jgi:hypothetical protein